jgi:sterol desaturase/sphingolipid hydroxylase (fatty acid hydroxylase superfamily)
MSIYLQLAIILALSAAAMFGLAALFRHPIVARFRIHPRTDAKPNGPKLVHSVLVNSVTSASLVYGVLLVLSRWLIHQQPTSLARMVFDGIAVLLLYDFLYYLTHRFAFHEWKLLRRVHTMHHAAKYPTALHSLYLHPVEMLIGLGLLLGCTMVVGPVHLHTFLVVFSAYSYLNIVIHAGLDLPLFGFRTVGYLARKHQKHHTSMAGGNYASITPLFDILFRTSE